MQVNTRNRIKLISLVLALFASMVCNTVLLVDFVINQEVIAKTLCVQRTNQLGCNGKCYLSKMLAEASDEPDGIPGPRFLELEIVFLQLNENNTGVSTDVPTPFERITPTGYQDLLLSRGFYEIDTPPPVRA
jgi:hypothetical protein